MMRNWVRRVFGNAAFLWGLLLAGLVMILWAGLNTRGSDSRNLVSWKESGSGLQFDGRGLAYTEPVLSAEDFAQGEGLSIELALTIEEPANALFQVLLEIDAKDESSHIVIGQWEREIIVMQGNDYSYSRRVPRVAMEVAEGKESFLLTVVSGKTGTRMYADGRLKARQSKLTLGMPDKARLVLGNSTVGLQPWTGEVHGAALYARVLEPKFVGGHAAAFRLDGTFGPFESDSPHLLYTFAKGGGDRIARDQSGQGIDLAFPEDVNFVKSDHFLEHLDYWNRGWQNTDALVLNFAGFVPFGLVLAALIRRSRSVRTTLLATLVVSFLLSLLIETQQAWMLSRISSLLDLTLNTMGGTVGACCYLIGLHHFLSNSDLDAKEEGESREIPDEQSG